MNARDHIPSEEISKNNTRIFKLFQSHLDPTNANSYAEITTRFAAWLNDPKAYYPSGRRQILELLLSIHRTLRFAVNHTPDLAVSFHAIDYLDNPMTLNYINLINVVSAYQQCFVEPDQHRALLWLLQSLEGIPGQPRTAMSQNQNNPTSSTQQTNLHPPPSIMNDSNHLAHPNFAVEQPQNLNPQPRQLMHSVPMSGPESLEIQRMLVQLSSPRQAVDGESSTTDQMIFDTTSTMEPRKPEPVEEPPQLSAGPNISTGGKNKAKKKKKLDLSAFIQKDVEDFKGKLSQAKEEPAKGPEIAKIDTSEDVTLDQDVPMGSGVDDQVALVNPQQDGQDMIQATNLRSTSEKSVTGPETPMHHTDDTDMSSQSPIQISPSIVPIASPAKAEVKIPVQKAKLQDNNSQQPEDERQPIPSPSSSIPVISKNQHRIEAQDIEMQDDTTTPHSAINPSAQNQSQNATSLSNSPDVIQTDSPPILQHPLLAKSQAPDLNIMDATQTESGQPSQTQAQTRRPFLMPEGSSLAMLRKWHEEYKAAAAASEKPKESNKQDLEEEETRLRYEQRLADDVLALDEIEKKNEQLPINIVAVQEGLGTAFTIELAVDMKQDSLNRVLKWINNNDVPIGELNSSSKCLTLACYYTHDVERIRKENKTGTVSDIAKALFYKLAPAWPQNGGISMNVNYHGARKTLPLAPPLLLTEDGLVDASEFLCNGGNLLQIHRQKECTERTLFLFSHHPTRNQLRTIVELRKKEVEWRKWLADITTPFQKPAAFR